MKANVVVSILALIVSLASFSFAWIASRDAAKAEDIKNLLGEKETVGFGALKLLRDGLPGSRTTFRFLPNHSKQRQLIIGALISACLFERSDRARSLLYSVIARYRDTPVRNEFNEQFAKFKNAIESMDRYQFTKEEFNPASAKVRLEAVKKVLTYEGS